MLISKNLKNKEIINNIRTKIKSFTRSDKSKDSKLIPTNMIRKMGNIPRCYLTGLKINLENLKEYSFDHKIPRSKGGEDTLDNCELCSRDVNQMKHDLKLEKFLIFSVKIFCHQPEKILDLINNRLYSDIITMNHIVKLNQIIHNYITNNMNEHTEKIKDVEQNITTTETNTTYTIIVNKNDTNYENKIKLCNAVNGIINNEPVSGNYFKDNNISKNILNKIKKGFKIDNRSGKIKIDDKIEQDVVYARTTLGITTDNVAKELNISEADVASIMKKHGYINGNYRANSLEIKLSKTQLEDYLIKGMTKDEIIKAHKSKNLGKWEKYKDFTITISTVNNALEKHGISMNDPKYKEARIKRRKTDKLSTNIENRKELSTNVVNVEEFNSFKKEMYSLMEEQKQSINLLIQLTNSRCEQNNSNPTQQDLNLQSHIKNSNLVDTKMDGSVNPKISETKSLINP